MGTAPLPRHAGSTARPPSLQALLADGLARHQRGQMQDAERLYRRVLAVAPRHANCLHLLGLLLQQTGRLEHAAEALDKAIAAEEQPSYHLSLGNLRAAQGRPEEAAACYRKVLALSPGDVDARNSLGNMYLAQGYLDEAIACYREAERTKPDYPGLQANLGEALRRAGRLEEAVPRFRRALGTDAASTALWNRLGNTYTALGRHDEAVCCYRRALECDSACVDAHNNLGNVLGALGRWDEAIASFRSALALRADFPDALSNLGNALKARGEMDAAVACYRRAIALKPDYVEAHYNLGNALREQGQPDDAVACFAKAINLRPDFVDVYVNLGGLLADQKMLDAAIACYDRAIALAPHLVDGHFNRAIALLAKGDLLAGWEEYEWRWQMPEMAAASPRYTQPRWRGEAASGRTILIHAEQGFGDTLQFCRYAPLVAARGLQVVMSVPKPLVRLLRNLSGVNQVIAEDHEPPPFDLHCPMLSLPLALQTTLPTIPIHIPYLHADRAQAAVWQDRLAAQGDGQRRVGLVWAGSARNHSPTLAAVDGRRSLPPEKLASLLELPGLQFFSLQKFGPPAPPVYALTDFMSEMEDFADTAALIANLDLVISVDTAVAHLAAALGKPVWLLDRFDSCWRWLTNRRDSPWYPTIRLYRQPSPGDWDAVVDEIARDLRKLN
ncbi:MAG TPA: tetratricopeptide repeat protein [Rhodopila sp.]|nr:tetratricopeptide repeat protein [Rhodopila sp.]